ncbi:MAG: archaeal proteasome endopeptidase complex subunit beta [Candidatus Methanosuratincola sp.]|nr:archaeal proteasome endopeptidase complex subunit beta [Candidatus Methanosuratincola sp.]
MPEAQFGYPVTGATTVGIACKDGVVLASEKRVTYGFSIMTKAGKKVFAINNRLGVAFAGLISDSQAVLRRISAETNLYELETRKPMSVRAMAKILANLLYAQRAYPVYTETMVGGMDEDGAKLFVLDPLGSMIEDRYAALGTGGAIAIGIVESAYSPEMGVEAGKDLAIRAVRAAISRDVASGDGVDVLVISKQGAIEETLPAK